MVNIGYFLSSSPVYASIFSTWYSFFVDIDASLYLACSMFVLADNLVKSNLVLTLFVILFFNWIIFYPVLVFTSASDSR
jgi:hypothetical protein